MISLFQGATADDVWQQVAQAFRQSDGAATQNGRGGPTRELLHAAISVEDPRQRWAVSRRPALNPALALAEVVWIMTGRRDLAFLEFWSKEYRKFAGDGPELHGAYGYRIRRHLSIDQLDRAFRVLSSNPDTRQVVLQIWDSEADMPNPDGTPVNDDIPCNVMSVLKVRDGRLEWLQVIRSNDVFRGLPYNLVQFTSLQEILAGWLNIECGTYNQVSDSLHVYERNSESVLASYRLPDVAFNTDNLALPKDESDRTFRELEGRIEQLIDPDLRPGEINRLASWESAPQAYQNIMTVLAAETLRRQGDTESAIEAMSSCTNPAYQQLWAQWLARTSGRNDPVKSSSGVGVGLRGHRGETVP